MERDWTRGIDGSYHTAGWLVKRERVLSTNGRKRTMWALYQHLTDTWRLIAHYRTLRDAKDVVTATASWLGSAS